MHYFPPQSQSHLCRHTFSHPLRGPALTLMKHVSQLRAIPALFVWKGRSLQLDAKPRRKRLPKARNERASGDLASAAKPGVVTCTTRWLKTQCTRALIEANRCGRSHVQAFHTADHRNTHSIVRCFCDFG